MRWSKLKPISKSHLFKYVIQIWVFKKYRRKIRKKDMKQNERMNEKYVSGNME